jgi:hypothetical protein
MSIETAVTTLINALKAEGAAGAPWGNRVYLHAASEVVQIGGANAGDPAVAQWPFLELRGPDVVENTKRRADGAREVINATEALGTAQTRPWPRYYFVRFDVKFQTRVGHTADLTIPPTVELLRAIGRFEAWVARTRSIEGCDLVTLAALTSGKGLAPTPADLREATGRIEIRDVPNYIGGDTEGGGLTTVETATEIAVRRPGG